ncbi:MAG: hypothetical protein ACUZ8N_11545 [Candidatus Scalindua sp.]
MDNVTATMVIHQFLLYIFIGLSIAIVISFLILRHNSNRREKKLEKRDASLYKLGQEVLSS